ncbi:MAG: ATP-binding protein [Gemmatimonadaceae bacterium]
MASSPAGSIRLFVLGDARIETSVGEIEPTAELVFAAALYLILERKEPVSRRHLEALLWPDVEQSAASHRLRQTLLKLKRLGIPVQRVGNARLSLEHPRVTTDFAAFLEAPGHNSIPASLVLLPGYSPSFSQTFLEWLDGHRRAVEAIVTRYMLGTIARHRSRGQWADVEHAAASLRAIAPFNEEAALALAEAHAMRGSKIEGIRILDAYLNEIGSGPNDLRVQATLMRRRIADRTAPTDPVTSVDLPLVGRAAALSDMAAQLIAVKERHGQTCLILGEAGIGKSRLLSEFAGFAALQGFAIQRVQCRPSHKHRPLSAFIQLVPGLRGLRGAIGCSPDTLNYLDRLTQHRPLDDPSLMDDADPQWVYGRVLRALFDIVDAVADESPLLIQMEDVHWLDTPSCDVLADMVEWSKERRVFFALTGREQPDAWLEGLPSAVRLLPLPPLDLESATDLMLAIARRHGRAIDRTYVEWCVSVAEGNPYFLQELGTHWIETGSNHSVPASLSAVIGSRVDRLDQDALQVLQACALLENSSSLHRIEEVLGYEPHRLLHSMNNLGSAGMLVVEPEEPEGGGHSRVASKHELLSNVVLQRLTSPARAFLHRRIGLVLEKEVDTHLSTALLWDCAKHWQLAGDSKRALSLALSCARHLMTVGLSKEASEVYQRCTTFCITDRQHLEVLEGEALAFYRMSDWQKVRDITALARAVKDRAFPNETRHDDLELMDLRAEWQSLRWDEIALKALECLRDEEASPRHRVEAGIMAVMLLGFKGNADAVASAHRTVAELIKHHQLGAALDYQAQMVFQTGYGDIAKGVEAAKLLITEQHARGNVAELFRAHCNSAVTFRVAGLFDEAESSLLKALALAERYGLDLSLIRVLPMLANMALERGLLNDAISWYDRLSQITIHPSNRFGQLELGGIGARLALLDRDGDKALGLWNMSREEAQADPIYHRRAYNCALQTAIDMERTGIPDPTTLECLVDAYQYSKSGFHQAFAVSVSYAGLLRAGFNDRANDLWRDYTTLYRRESWPVPQHLVESALALGTGPSRRAAGPLPPVFGARSQRSRA